MRLAREIGGAQVPDAGEGGVVQLQRAVGAEHGDAFLQRVERRGLHLDQRVVGAFQRELFGDVLIEEREAAERMRLRHDAQRLAAGQMPQVFRQIFVAAA